MKKNILENMKHVCPQVHFLPKTKQMKMSLSLWGDPVSCISQQCWTRAKITRFQSWANPTIRKEISQSGQSKPYLKVVQWSLHCPRVLKMCCEALLRLLESKQYQQKGMHQSTSTASQLTAEGRGLGKGNRRQNRGWWRPKGVYLTGGGQNQWRRSLSYGILSPWPIQTKWSC